MKFPALDEAEGRLQLKRKELAVVFDEAGPEMDMGKVKSLTGDSKAKVEAIQALNAELDEMTDKVKELRNLFGIAEKAREANGNGGHVERGSQSDAPVPGVPAQTKSLGQLFVESIAYKEKKGHSGPEAHLAVEFKSTFQTSAGWTPETTRTGRVVDFATRPIQVTDLFPTTTTTQAAVKYMEETTFTNNAAETAEAGQYPESALALTERISPVQKVATFLPITDEQLEDVTQAMGYVDNRLRFMVRQRLDGQLIVGNGTSPNLRGLLNVSGIQTQALGADPAPDAIYKAMVKIMVTGRANPDSVIIHPSNWQTIKLLRTADGIYIWGSPSEATPDRIWGMPVAKSDAITLGTSALFDSSFTEISNRAGIDVQVSNSHNDFFVRGQQAVRADLRCAFIVYRPAAVCTVTGLL
jgi:HK97 family phage major capsid protein